jgi:hypothetical protein
MIKIDVSYDHVVVCGVQVRRPSCISPKQWMDKWGAMKEVEEVGSLEAIKESCRREGRDEAWSEDHG